MDGSDHLVIGASARAAAFSALRAGLRPWCADLFADADLVAHCPVIRLAVRDYPAGFASVIQQAPARPWMYTGGLENRPELVADIARRRPLWGNDAEALARARSPQFVADLLHSADLSTPALRLPVDGEPTAGHWLVKPLGGAGGTGIRFWPPARSRLRRRGAHYFQEYIEGESCSAVYVATDGSARLLGASRQLVGTPWLCAQPFQYCGSIGFAPDERLERDLETIGRVLTHGCKLRGLFGVDFIIRDGRPWLVEVNPRYTASVEVIEHMTGVAALGLHRSAFDCHAPQPPVGMLTPGVIGKAILFARAPVVFPEDGPWRDCVTRPPPLWELPAFADVPREGEPIDEGRPICTFFAKADSEPACHQRLRQVAQFLDDLLDLAG